jgi:hypothetical protein
MDQRSNSLFDVDGNWQGESSPQDIVEYWNGLDSTAQAFEMLSNTDAAIYMKFYNALREESTSNVP